MKQNNIKDTMMVERTSHTVIQKLIQDALLDRKRLKNSLDAENPRHKGEHVYVVDDLHFIIAEDYMQAVIVSNEFSSEDQSKNLQETGEPNKALLFKQTDQELVLGTIEREYWGFDYWKNIITNNLSKEAVMAVANVNVTGGNLYTGELLITPIRFQDYKTSTV